MAENCLKAVLGGVAFMLFGSGLNSVGYGDAGTGLFWFGFLLIILGIACLFTN